ncbi:MAG TPA: MBL fold metallo-hydrolase [Acidimicrobiales bacterium]|nr:MBL fold metallo-hydrolase [Acidimicrobiales bacterium]
MDPTYQALPDVHVIPSHLEVPGVGVILVNAFVLLAEQPVLIDTGLAVETEPFMAALEAVIDPAELRWVWLTHDDSDHTGSLGAVMARAPQAKLATHGLGALRASTCCPIPLDRVHALQVGDELDVGDRTLHAMRPPVFDNPVSIGIYDDSTRTLFPVDTFGAILPGVLQDAADYAEPELVGGMVAWTAFDSPWTHLVDRAKFAAVLDGVRQLDATNVLSSHLPAAKGCLDQFLKIVESVPDADPFVPPDHVAFAAIVAQMGPPPSP